MSTTEKLRKKPGRIAGPPMTKTTILLPAELLEWGKQQPGGLAALIRRLLEKAYTTSEKSKG